MWTKKTPKSPGFYWFWHSGSEAQIVQVIAALKDDPDGDWLLNLMTNVQIRIGDTPIYYIGYHFGPKIRVPSIRDLKKRNRKRGKNAT